MYNNKKSRITSYTSNENAYLDDFERTQMENDIIVIHCEAQLYSYFILNFSAFLSLDILINQILIKKKVCMLTLISYNDAVTENLQWISSIKKLLEAKDVLSLFLYTYETKPPFIYKKIYQILQDEFHERAIQFNQFNLFQ